jgi:ABC-type multidrug transport system fused ATPase/permease subunit
MKKFKLILQTLTKKDRKQLIFVILALLVMGFIELIGIGSIGPFISVISNPDIIHTNTYLNKVYVKLGFESDMSFVTIFGVVVILILVFSNACLAVTNFIIYYYSGKKRHSFSMRLFEKYLRQPYVFYLNVNTASLQRGMEDVNSFVNDILINLLNLISSSIISLSIVILLIIINPLLALIISFVLGFFYFLTFSVVKKILNKKGEERNIVSKLRNKFRNEAFGGIKDIKILGKEKVFLNLFSGPSLKFSMNDAFSNIINDAPKYIIETLAIGGMLSIIIVMIHSGSQINEFLPLLTVYAFGAYRLLPILQKIFRAFTNIRYKFPIVENLNKDFNTLPEGNEIVGENIQKLNFYTNIKLENITFSYPNTTKETINNISLSIRCNTSTAFVGFTGCGKTTLADIILGLLQPQSGNIFIDNILINDSNRQNWQKNFGYVPQSIYLTDDSIKNNIAFGIAPDKIDENAVITAAKLANIHDFVFDELKDGYNTIIGERGIRLSGGQRQRIGIARSVYHNPSVLIFDEATSALDSLTENAIMDAIKNMAHKKTIIIIAHRITTVKYCDVIYLMDKGQIIDSGNYEELYNKNESFRKMADGV